MQFRIPADQVKDQFKFALLAPEDFTDAELVQDRDGNTRLFDVKPAYRPDLIVMDLSCDTPRQLQGTTVKVHTKPAGGKVSAGLDVRLTGDLLETPWVNYRQNNRLCYSIVADGFAQSKISRSE